MKLINSILIILLLSSCATQESSQKAAVYAKPSSFIGTLVATETVLDKSKTPEKDIERLRVIANSMLLVAKDINKEITQEEFSNLITSGEKSGKWVLLAHTLYDIYSSSVSNDRVKNTSIVLKGIAEGMLDAINLRVLFIK